MLPNHLDYGWFSPDDFTRVVSQVAKHPEPQSFVVVGGQSVVAWAIALGIEIPQTEAPYLTQDVDLIAPIKHAQWLAEQLDAEFHSAPIDEPVSTAQLVLLNHDGTQKLTIDVLRCVYGVEREPDLSKWAIPLSFDGSPQIWVLHPIWVLQSRLANLYGLPEKRTSNGEAQARVAIEVVRRFLARESPDSQLREVRKVAEISASPAGVHCFAEYGLDPMGPLREWFAGYWANRMWHWPSMMRQVERKRRVERRRREGTIHQPKDK